MELAEKINRSIAGKARSLQKEFPIGTDGERIKVDMRYDEYLERIPYDEDLQQTVRQHKALGNFIVKRLVAETSPNRKVRKVLANAYSSLFNGGNYGHAKPIGNIPPLRATAFVQDQTPA